MLPKVPSTVISLSGVRSTPFGDPCESTLARQNLTIDTVSRRWCCVYLSTYDLVGRDGMCSFGPVDVPKKEAQTCKLKEKSNTGGNRPIRASAGPPRLRTNWHGSAKDMKQPDLVMCSHSLLEIKLHGDAMICPMGKMGRQGGVEEDWGLCMYILHMHMLHCTCM